MLELTAPSSSECKAWFKHISDAAEQHKPRSKSIHDIEDSVSTTNTPHSIPKEVSNQDRNLCNNNNNNNNNVNQIRLPTYMPKNNEDSINNKTVCNNNFPENQENENLESNNNANYNNITDEIKDASCKNKEKERNDSIYSNNSNNTRTLMQHCTLLEPTDITISIDSSHTAQPVLTISEQLKRLDKAISEKLYQKERIVCDMFRVPHEDFTSIIDIAVQPEAPMDLSDISLAAFSQTQALTDILMKYMQISPDKEVIAKSTSLCDKCLYRKNHSLTQKFDCTSRNSGDTSIAIKSSKLGKYLNLDNIAIHEDDGYCEIDELRLPAVMTTSLDGQTNINKTDLAKRFSTISLDSICEKNEVSIDVPVGERKSSEVLVTSGISNKAGTSENQKILDSTIMADHKTETMTSILNKSIDKKSDCSCQNFGMLNCICAHHFVPSVPCYILNGLVTTLSSQISLLLSKVNDRDTERDRLRRENQHLRLLLESVYEQRIDEDRVDSELSNNS